MKKYPTKEDIERHTQQFVGSLRQYLRGVNGVYFIWDGFNCLFTDLTLEAHNEGKIFEGVEINANKFLKKLSDTPKQLKQIYNNYIKKEVIKSLK